jgi:hypothetical protein
MLTAAKTLAEAGYTVQNTDAIRYNTGVLLR